MKYRDIIHNYVCSKKEEIIKTLIELVKVPSVKGDATENAPFGTQCANVLEVIKDMYSLSGFETELSSNGGYLLSFYGKGEKSIGIFAHADVVPAGDDWIYTKPFEPVVKDGCIIGRGTLDDKSAVVISLYCAKMLKELNIPFNSRLVLFTGANEESGMADIENYLKTHVPPDFALVPDTGFPLFRGNKGILHFVATSNIKLKDISEFSGGSAFNIILGEAKAKCGGMEYSKKGISKHAALPDGSVNAAFLLANELKNIENICETDRIQMEFTHNILKENYGEVFGIKNNDSEFGPLTVANGKVYLTNGKLNLCFDIRYGNTVDINAVKEKIVNFFAQNNWSVNFVLENKPYLLSSENPYVKSCLKVYKDFTGENNAVPWINAGGTYARHLPCAIEVGPATSRYAPFDLPNGHGSVHQPDEFVNIDGLLEAFEIIALMLLECDKI